MNAPTIWLTGLPRAGKSTIARLVEGRLREEGIPVEVLDGEATREHLATGLGYSRADRDTNVRRIAYVADLLSRNGVVVLAAAIAPYRETREEVRELLGDRFVEVHVKASVQECARRDESGLYAAAMAGRVDRFTGVSDPYEEPPSPELVLETEHETPEQSAAKVLEAISSRTFGSYSPR